MCPKDSNGQCTQQDITWSKFNLLNVFKVNNKDNTYLRKALPSDTKSIFKVSNTESKPGRQIRAKVRK